MIRSEWKEGGKKQVEAEKLNEKKKERNQEEEGKGKEMSLRKGKIIKYISMERKNMEIREKQMKGQRTKRVGEEGEKYMKEGTK